jgi:hypothetical protein
VVKLKVVAFAVHFKGFSLYFLKKGLAKLGCCQAHGRAAQPSRPVRAGVGHACWKKEQREQAARPCDWMSGQGASGSGGITTSSCASAEEA